MSSEVRKKDGFVSGGIDIVIPWVDDSDPSWKEQRVCYSDGLADGFDDSEARFRDWGLLKYVFRGIHAFAPWVRTVHFVTWGHLPEWLNRDYEKIHVVKHQDFIPEQYLPTFSATSIEWNLYRIEGLSDRFVYFNDDTFLLSPVKESDFFKNDVPCASPSLEPFRVTKGDWFYTPATNCAILNSHFSLRRSFLRHPAKWINPRYRLKANASTLLMLLYPYIYGFFCAHLPNAFLKETFEEIWHEEYELLDRTCRHRFRDKTDPNQWLAEQWQYMKGEFEPRSMTFGKAFQLGEYVGRTAEVVDYIVGQQGKMICLNDMGLSSADSREMAIEFQKCFSRILPDKSPFEN